MKIIMYTKNDCPECKKLKAVMGYMPIEAEIETRNIDEDPQWLLDMSDMGYSSVPITFVEGMEKPIVGFEVGELQEAFGL